MYSGQLVLGSGKQGAVREGKHCTRWTAHALLYLLTLLSLLAFIWSLRDYRRLPAWKRFLKLIKPYRICRVYWDIQLKFRNTILYISYILIYKGVIPLECVYFSVFTKEYFKENMSDIFKCWAVVYFVPVALLHRACLFSALQCLVTWRLLYWM